MVKKKKVKKTKEKTSNKDKSKVSETKEEVCEIFDIEKKGHETEKKVCDLVEKKHATKEEIKKQNKTLRNILIGLGIFVLLILLGIYYINSARHFEYRGISGNVIKEGELIFYQVPIPLIIQGQKIEYSIYLRNNPETLDKIPFEGEMVDFRKLSTFSDGTYRLILNSTSEFDCDKDEVIAVGNMLNLKALGFKLVKDENATCDEQGRYIFINLQESDYSGIKQIGKGCYELNIADCEILKVTERFMTEMFVMDNEIRNS